MGAVLPTASIKKTWTKPQELYVSELILHQSWKVVIAQSMNILIYTEY